MKDTWIGENTELPAHLLVLQLEDGFNLDIYVDFFLTRR